MFKPTSHFELVFIYWYEVYYFKIRLFNCSASFVEKIVPSLLNFLSISIQIG